MKRVRGFFKTYGLLLAWLGLLWFTIQLWPVLNSPYRFMMTSGLGIVALTPFAFFLVFSQPRRWWKTVLAGVLACGLLGFALYLLIVVLPAFLAAPL